jgi:UDP-2,3-diacylglucosamine pyrophosphatase LpxH
MCARDLEKECIVFDGSHSTGRENSPAAIAPQAGASSAGHDAATPSKMNFRSIWISDVHLGTLGCQSEQLLEFLRHTESKHLFLVGDIIDGWALKRKWYWHQSHNDIVQKVLRKARKGTEVTFIAGNHDEVARQFVGLAFGGIAIADEVVHVTADGRRVLILHGDQFDGVVQYAKWLAYLGDYLYEVSLKVNRVFNRVRRKLGMPYWSLSQYLKHKVKNAVSFITAFEEAVARAARERGMDAVVCGHIHRPEMRDIGGVLYCNDGDWVESLSALVETHEGELKLLMWNDLQAIFHPAAPVPAKNKPQKHRQPVPLPLPHAAPAVPALLGTALESPRSAKLAELLRSFK